MINLDLEAIKKQLASITEGPWEADLEDGCVDAGGITVCSITHHGWVRTEISNGTKFKHEDVTFIAQAPQTISELVVEVESLRFELEDRFGTEDILVETRHKLVAANAEIERLRKEISRLRNPGESDATTNTYCEELNCASTPKEE